MAIADYLSNYDQNNENLFRDDDLFNRNNSLFRENGHSRQKHMESGSLSSASSSNLSGVLQRSSNSNLTSNGHTSGSEMPEQSFIVPNSKYSNSYGSNHNLISSTDGSSDRQKLAKENLQRLEREKDDLYEL